MADQKISELIALTGANVADDDAIAIVDTSATETKKIVFSELKNALDTATGFVRITGDTMTGNLSMGDNVKAIFGAGSDLQIYHDGSNSYIKDTATGNLNISGNDVQILNAASNEAMAYFAQDGDVTLYHNGVSKIATKATGVDVTGTVTAGGLTVDTNTLHVDSTNNRVGVGTSSPSTRLTVGAGAGSEEIRVDAGAGWADLTLNSNATNGGHIYFNDGSNAGEIFYYHASDYMAFNTAGTEAMRISSAGDVGIGCSPASGVRLDIRSNATTTLGDFRNASATGFGLYVAAGDTSSQYAFRAADYQNNALFSVMGDGNVGIGTSSPQGVLDLGSASTGRALTFAKYNNIFSEYSEGGLHLASNYYGSTSANSYITSNTATFGAAGINISGVGGSSSSGVIEFFTDAATSKTAGAAFTPTERMRIDSSGNVGIGTSSVDRGKLHVNHYNSISAGVFNDAHLALTFNTSPSDNDGYSGITYATSDSDNYGWSVGARRTNSGVGDFVFTQHTNSATGTERMRINASGRVGIGVTPEFSSTFSALELGTTALITPSNTNGRLVTNLYYDGVYKRKHVGGSLQYEQDGTAGHIWYYDSSASADSSFTQTEMMRLDTSGNLKCNLGNFIVGTAGKGIDFSATSGTGTSELLDDYEEGNYTPTVTATGGGSIPINASYDKLAYTKIGRQVTITGLIVAGTVSSPSGTLRISLPYVVASLTDTSERTCPMAVCYFNGSTPNGNGYYATGLFINHTGVDYFDIWGFPVSGTADVTIADWVSGGSDIQINLTYFTN